MNAAARTHGKANKLLEGPILKSLLTLAIPIVLANVLQSAYQIIDAFWVGRLGGAAVAAVSISFPVMFLMIALGMGLAMAGSTLTAQYRGAGNDTMVSHVAAQTLNMVATLSIVLSVLGYFAAPSLLRTMGVGPDVYPGALGFMRVSFIALLFNFTFFVFQSIMRGVGRPTLPVYIVLVTVILNFALDPLFIFGWGPVPGYGVMGAALATLATQVLAAIAGMIVLRAGRHGIHLKPHDFIPDVAYMKRAFYLGAPASVEQSARALGLMVLIFLIASFGTRTMAAYGVGSNIVQVVIIPAFGLSMAISVLAGQNIGAGNVERAAKIGRLGAELAFGILTGIGIIVFAFAPAFAAFFVPHDPGVIAAAAHFLRIMALAWGFMGLQLALTGVLRASGNMMTTMMLTLTTQWVIQFPLAYILSKHTSLQDSGIWWAFPVTNVIGAAIVLAVYARGDWKKTKLISRDDKAVAKIAEEAELEEPMR
ncbi:MAG: MATE family efflux transporter [Pseudomonadota bacterium]